ncbi:hypothetical protein H2201_002867 [Coniosporium apollinis]|uniref:Uncharacterized protein n=1 Tax=Coniosporium apollinis TaxID=61459 RepID=A0ABQ9NYI6_9PEZI|nr:hypothetical protein H2201_002867 [Coniosporium apollinis]
MCNIQAAGTASHEDRHRTVKAIELLPISDDEAQNQERRNKLAVPDTTVADLPSKFNGSSETFKTRPLSQFRREHYQRSRCQPRCTAPSRLRTELHPEDIAEPAERRAPFSTFRSFFVQTYGSSGPDVGIRKRTGTEEPLSTPASATTHEASALSSTAPVHDGRYKIQTAQPHEPTRLMTDIEGGGMPAPKLDTTFNSTTLCCRPGSTLNAGCHETVSRAGRIRT